VRFRDVLSGAKQWQQQQQAQQQSSHGSTGGSGHPHMLNCTLAATQRTLCCIMENYQTREGIRVSLFYTCNHEALRFCTGSLTMAQSESFLCLPPRAALQILLFWYLFLDAMVGSE